MKLLRNLILIGILLLGALLPTTINARKLVCVNGVPHYQICVHGHWHQHGARGHCFLKPVYYYYAEHNVCHNRSYHHRRHHHRHHH